MKGGEGDQSFAVLPQTYCVFTLHYCMLHDLAFSDFGHIASLRAGGEQVGVNIEEL